MKRYCCPGFEIAVAQWFFRVVVVAALVSTASVETRHALSLHWARFYHHPHSKLKYHVNDWALPETHLIQRFWRGVLFHAKHIG